MARLLHRRTDAHLVDDVGLVGCPQRGCDVPVEACLDCPALRGVRRDDGRIVEIRCEGPRQTLRGAAGPLGLPVLWDG